jgi:hypothetical protein
MHRAQDGADWINLAKDRDKWRHVNITEIKIWVPKSAGSCLTDFETVSFSR